MYIRKKNLYKFYFANQNILHQIWSDTLFIEFKSLIAATIYEGEVSVVRISESITTNFYSPQRSYLFFKITCKLSYLLKSGSVIQE